jgi:hypothetical protein
MYGHTNNRTIGSEQVVMGRQHGLALAGAGGIVMAFTL